MFKMLLPLTLVAVPTQATLAADLDTLMDRPAAAEMLDSGSIESHRKIEIIATAADDRVFVKDSIYLVNFSDAQGYYRYSLGQASPQEEVKVLGYKLPVLTGSDDQGLYVEGPLTKGTNRVTLQYLIKADKNSVADLSITSDETLVGVQVFYNKKHVKVSAPTFQEFSSKFILPGLTAIEDSYFTKGESIQIRATLTPTPGFFDEIVAKVNRIFTRVKIAYIEATDPDPMGDQMLEERDAAAQNKKTSVENKEAPAQDKKATEASK
jgi:hypothetical protein